MEPPLQSLLDAMGDAVLFRDVSGVLVAANAQAIRLLGYSAHDFPFGTTDHLPRWQRVDATTVAANDIEAATRQALDSGELASCWARYIRADGSVLGLTIRIAPVKSADGKTLGVLKTLIPASGVPAPDNPFGDTLDLATLSVIVHELRNPITAVGGFTTLGLRANSSGRNEDVRVHLEHLDKVHGHLSGVLTALAELGAARDKPTTPMLREVSLLDLLNEVRALLSGKLHQTGVALDCNAPKRAVLMTEPTYVRQILLNLVDNAVKFNPTSGTVAVRVVEDSAGTSIHVEDQGPGIPPESMRQLFLPFSRPTPGSASRAGVGLGLAISQCLAGRLGACITVDSALGRGTTFTLRLPR